MDIIPVSQTRIVAISHGDVAISVLPVLDHELTKPCIPFLLLLRFISCAIVDFPVETNRFERGYTLIGHGTFAACMMQCILCSLHAYPWCELPQPHCFIIIITIPCCYCSHGHQTITIFRLVHTKLFPSFKPFSFYSISCRRTRSSFCRLCTRFLFFSSVWIIVRLRCEEV